MDFKSMPFEQFLNSVKKELEKDGVTGTQVIKEAVTLWTKMPPVEKQCYVNISSNMNTIKTLKRQQKTSNSATKYNDPSDGKPKASVVIESNEQNPNSADDIKLESRKGLRRPIIQELCAEQNSSSAYRRNVALDIQSESINQLHNTNLSEFKFVVLNSNGEDKKENPFCRSNSLQKDLPESINANSLLSRCPQYKLTSANSNPAPEIKEQNPFLIYRPESPKNDRDSVALRNMFCELKQQWEQTNSQKFNFTLNKDLMLDSKSEISSVATVSNTGLKKDCYDFKNLKEILDEVEKSCKTTSTTKNKKRRPMRKWYRPLQSRLSKVSVNQRLLNIKMEKPADISPDKIEANNNM